MLPTTCLLSAASASTFLLADTVNNDMWWDVTTRNGCRLLRFDIRNYFLSVMPPLLQSVEEKIGPIGGWPRNILRLLFSSPRSVANVRAVTCFFYGNGVAADLAYQLYDACMPTRTGVRRDVLALYNWFEKVASGWGVHLGEYYDLRRHLYMYINGPRYPKSPFLETVVLAPHYDFCFGSILCPETDAMLQHVRCVRVYCGTPFCTHSTCKCTCLTCRSLACRCVVCTADDFM
jgi:hypothetical protein